MIPPAAFNVSLARELAAFMAAQVASGRFGTAGQVVRAALRSFGKGGAGFSEQARAETGSPRP